MTQWHKYHFRKSSPRGVLLNKSPNDGGAEGRRGRGARGEIVKLWNCILWGMFFLCQECILQDIQNFFGPGTPRISAGTLLKRCYQKKLQKKNIFWRTIHFVYKIFHETNISYPLISTWTCAFQGLRNISFSENSANVASDP